jgi:hypothetical protein
VKKTAQLKQRVDLTKYHPLPIYIDILGLTWGQQSTDLKGLQPHFNHLQSSCTLYHAATKYQGTLCVKQNLNFTSYLGLGQKIPPEKLKMEPIICTKPAWKNIFGLQMFKVASSF